MPIFVANSQGNAKNRAGVAYGIFLGWIGVIILAALPPLADHTAYGECPYCKESIRLDASVCPHCQRDVEPTIPSEPEELPNPAFKGGVRPTKR